MARWLWLVLGLAGCGGPGARAPPAQPVDAGAAGVFIALDRDFEPYRSWPSFRIEGGGQYPRIVYVKRRPPDGAPRFPVGTIIVKELLQPAALGGLEVDAMAKRGGGFGGGDGGAAGWEWFSLEVDGGAPTIIGRGPGSGGAMSNYGGSGVSCVGCHAAARENDYVQSPELRL